MSERWRKMASWRSNSQMAKLLSRKMLLTQITNGNLQQLLSDDLRVAFNKWYQDQVSADSLSTNSSQSAATGDSSPLKNDVCTNHSNHRKSLVFSPGESDGGVTYQTDTGSNLLGSRTHIRTWFDPDTELPRLQAWLMENKHPTKVEMTRYLQDLNSREYRQTHRPLDLSNLAYWFKNARARSAVHRAGEPPGGWLVGDTQPDREQQRESDDDEPVPILPNKNAVYVIRPLRVTSDASPADPARGYGGRETSSPPHSEDEAASHHSASLKRDRGDENKEDENHNDRLPLIMHDLQTSALQRSDRLSSSKDRLAQAILPGERLPASIQLEATDLSVRSVRQTSVDEQSSMMDSSSGSSDIPAAQPTTPRRASSPIGSPTHSPTRSPSIQRMDDYDDLSGSESSSPRPRVESRSLPPQFNLPPHLHALHQQHALQMAAMSHAMRFIHPLQGGAPPFYNSPGRNMFMGAPHLGLPHPGASHPSPHIKPVYDDDSHLDSSSSLNGDASDRKKRSRVFIDPLSEIPKLEQWFIDDSHPSSFVIEQFTDELNRATYRQRFPRLEAKNVQLWFKNHRAKVKRQRLEFSVPASGRGSDGARSSTPSFNDEHKMFDVTQQRNSTPSFVDAHKMYDINTQRNGTQSFLDGPSRSGDGVPSFMDTRQIFDIAQRRTPSFLDGPGRFDVTQRVGGVSAMWTDATNVKSELMGDS